MNLPDQANTHRDFVFSSNVSNKKFFEYLVMPFLCCLCIFFISKNIVPTQSTSALHKV